MEVVDIQEQPCKFSRIGNGGNDSNKVAVKGIAHSPDDEDDGELSKKVSSVAGGVKWAGGGGSGGVEGRGAGTRASANHLLGWHHSSRIIRVARASGGKDRHSKVWTSKGLRDRRVRLSVATAIQFYDLQDRLGFEQPSKAVEWLIEAASGAIAELPSLNSTFPETPKQMSDEKMASDGTDQGFDSTVELDGEPKRQQNQRQLLSLASSSASETSKGSGLSLSRSEILVNRAKARDRARERTAKEKEREQESRNAHTISNSPSFTELLTGSINGGINNRNSNITNSTTSAQQTNVVEPNLFDKATAMDYLATSGIIGQSSSSSRPGQNQSAGFSGQFFLGNPHQLPMSAPPLNISAADSNQERLQHIPFVPENLNDYNLNFTISAGLAGFNRGTLQSNISPSLLPYLQRFPHLDGPNVPVFIGAASPAAPVQSENHQQHHHQLTPALFDGSWQLCYTDGSHHSDQKGKGKN